MIAPQPPPRRGLEPFAAHPPHAHARTRARARAGRRGADYTPLAGRDSFFAFLLCDLPPCPLPNPRGRGGGQGPRAAADPAAVPCACACACPVRPPLRVRASCARRWRWEVGRALARGLSGRERRAGHEGGRLRGRHRGGGAGQVQGRVRAAPPRCVAITYQASIGYCRLEGTKLTQDDKDTPFPRSGGYYSSSGNDKITQTTGTSRFVCSVFTPGKPPARPPARPAYPALPQRAARPARSKQVGVCSGGEPKAARSNGPAVRVASGGVRGRSRAPGWRRCPRAIALGPLPAFPAQRAICVCWRGRAAEHHGACLPCPRPCPSAASLPQLPDSLPLLGGAVHEGLCLQSLRVLREWHVPF